LVLITMLVGAAVGWVTTSRVAEYRTTAELYVGSRDLVQDPSQLYLEPGLNQVVATFATMIPSAVIAEKAVTATGVPRSAGTVVSETKANVVANTNLIDVTVTDVSPTVAEALANGISNAFVAQVQDYEPGTGSVGSVPSEPAYVFQDAYLPSTPLSSGLTRKVLVGVVFGFVISVLLVLLLDYLDISVKGPDELERRLDLPVLGVVPFNRSLTERMNVG
jgi:capsular polysaccharide biosynthesis protein